MFLPLLKIIRNNVHCVFSWDVKYFFLLAFLPADRRGLHSLSQRPWGTFDLCHYARQILKLSAVIIVRSYFYASFYPFQWRCSVVLVRFHSSFCPSLVATGSRGPIISLQSCQKVISLLVLPPISNWRQTAQLKYTGSISWGRWEMEDNWVQMLQWFLPLKYSHHAVK